ncbi:hypothetical protein TrST_g7840 [Triparma strigata]|uniref:CRAL-TRIO domain-containing protein n=1 Tax=Triparma strigata TaxID=1606541 RepID=A0A9W7AUJ8_9STRA|nr:hypothetical protein TrST_g7840 [Triparma strigata]
MRSILRPIPLQLSLLLLSILVALSPLHVKCYAPVPQLLQIHRSTIEQLKLDPRTSPLPSDPPLPYPDMFYLRHILEYDEGLEEEDEGAINLLSGIQQTLAWRRGPGVEICTSASDAISLALSSGVWDNDPVLSAAPHSTQISPYLKSSIITTPSSTSDLIYCIRAGSIDDVSLMSAVPVESLIDFFLYAKEVNCQIADSLSLKTGRFTRVITANDLSGVNIFGDASFRKALSEASTTSSKIYPQINGPTLLLNLPRVLSALVKLFKPIFPKKVQEKLKFKQGPLKGVEDLREISREGEKRDVFLKQIRELVEDS